MERERTKEPDADQLSDYDKTIRHYQEWAERQKSGKLLIRGDERQFQVSRQGIIKYYLNALFTDTAVSSWGVFEHLIKRQSGRHKHQGGIIIYVLEGHGERGAAAAGRESGRAGERESFRAAARAAGFAAPAPQPGDVVDPRR